MENLKIFVRTKEESQEAQELFFDLGVSWCFGKELNNNLPSDLMFILHNDGSCLYWSDAIDCNAISGTKEITLPELRDLVVLKRNDVGDATHESPNKELKFTLIGDWWNLFTGGKWQQFCHVESPRCTELKPIEKKESLSDKVVIGESYSSMSQTTFIERELCKSSLNHTVANAFCAIRGDMVRLTEDDVRLIQELTELTKTHGDVWK